MVTPCTAYRRGADPRYECTCKRCCFGPCEGCSEGYAEVNYTQRMELETKSLCSHCLEIHEDEYGPNLNLQPSVADAWMYEAESKKLPPVEKAIDTGIASGATMEGLDLALGAEGIDKDIKEYWYHFGRENWKFIPLHRYQNSKLNKSMKSCVKDWLNDEYSEDSPERMVSEFYDFNDEIPTPTDAQQEREIRHLTSVIRKIAKEMDENGEWKRYMWNPHVLSDLQMRDIIHGDWDAESVSAEEYRVADEDSAGMSCEDCYEEIKTGDLIHDAYGILICKKCYSNYKIPCEHEACDERFKDKNEEEEHRQESCNKCGGEGWIMTSYTPATYHDPADGDGEDCDECWGDGWVCDKFNAEEPSVYWWVKGALMEKMKGDRDITIDDVENIIVLVAANAPLNSIDKGMKEAEQFGDKSIWEMLKLAAIGRSEILSEEEIHSEKLRDFQADYPTVRPNCKCGATLEWDNLRKSWYCIKCPFNTYKAERDEPPEKDDPLESWMEDFDAETERWIRIPHSRGDDYWEGSPPPFYGKGYGTDRIFTNEQEARKDYEKLIREEPSITGYRGGSNIGVECGCGNFVLKEEPIWNHPSSIRGWDSRNHPIQVYSKNIDSGHYYSKEEPTLEEWEFATRWKEGEKNIVEIEYATKDHLEFERITYMPMKMLEAESFSADAQPCPKCKTASDYICDSCLQCKRCCETSYGCYDVALCNDCDGSFIGKDIDGCCGSCDDCCECKNAESNGDITIRQQAIDTIEARVADYSTHEDVNRYEGNPNQYLYHKLRYAWDNHPEQREEIIQQYIRGIQDGRIDPSNPLPHGAPNQHLPSQWDAETWFDNMGEWPGWAENRHRFNPFTGQEEKDPQLEESIKRTKMSALRTGLAITTFGIVMWNLWTNKKQEKDISDIMAEI